MLDFIATGDMICTVRGFTDKDDTIGYIVEEDVLNRMLQDYGLDIDYANIKQCKNELFSVFQDRETYVMIDIFENGLELC